MKTIKFLLITLVLCLVFTSCSKDDEPTTIYKVFIENEYGLQVQFFNKNKELITQITVNGDGVFETTTPIAFIKVVDNKIIESMNTYINNGNELWHTITNRDQYYKASELTIYFGTRSNENGGFIPLAFTIPTN